MVKYLKELDVSRTVLWCYLIWYLVTVQTYFDTEPMLWLNAAGIGLVVGFALKLGVSGVGDWTAAPWQMFRLFATPFCVSSFSMLTVGKGYYLVIPPDNMTLVISLGGCVAFVVVVLLVKRFT